MKKVIFLLAALGAIYSAFWFYGASKSKQVIEDKLQFAASKLKEDGYVLEYKNLSIKGFPFNYEAKIESPSIKKIEDQKNKSPLEAVFMDGSLSLISNLLGTEFSILKDGNIRVTYQSTTQKLESKKTEYISSGISEVSLSIYEKSYFDSIKNPFKSMFEVMEKDSDEFLVGKKGSIYLRNVKWVNAENPSISLFEIEKGDLDYQLRDLDDGQTEIILKSDFKGIDLDTLMVGHEAYLPGNEKSLREIALLMSIPKPGKTDIAFDIYMKANFHQLAHIDQMKDLSSILPFDIKIESFKVKNKFGNSLHQAQVSLDQEKDHQRNFHFDISAFNQMSKSEFQVFQKSWEDFLSNLPVCEERVPEAVESTCPLFKALIPKLDELGKITLQIDFDLLFANLQDPTDNTKLTINHFDYYADPYGLKSDGYFHFKQPEMVLANYEIHLANYKDLFRDFFDYFDKLLKVLPIINPEIKTFNFNKEKSYKEVINFLKDISDEPKQDLKDLKITIRVKGPADIQVGELSIEQFIQKIESLSSSVSKDFIPVEALKEGEKSQ